MSMRVHQLIRVSGGRPTATSGHRTAHRKRWDDLERIMRMVSSAIPIITFRYYPYKRKKLTFWVSLEEKLCVCYSGFRSELCNLFHFHYVQSHFRFHNTVHIPGHGLCKLESSIGTYIFARCTELHIVCAGSGFPP